MSVDFKSFGLPLNLITHSEITYVCCFSAKLCKIFKQEKKMDGTKARQTEMEISPSFTVSHISLTAEHNVHTQLPRMRKQDPTDAALKGNDGIPILWQRSGNGKCKQNTWTGLWGTCHHILWAHVQHWWKFRVYLDCCLQWGPLTSSYGPYLQSFISVFFFFSEIKLCGALMSWLNTTAHQTSNEAHSQQLYHLVFQY